MIEKIAIQLNEMEQNDSIKEFKESYLYYTHSLPLFLIEKRILFFFHRAMVLILSMPGKRLLLNQKSNENGTK